jgi:glycosyltransferase involved in cell wall biosynthesis
MNGAPHIRSLELEGRRAQDSGSVLAFSVVVVTRDRPPLLRRCLEVVLAQMGDVGGGEVVVVDDGGGIALSGIPDDPRVRLVLGAQEGPARARNRGIEAAQGAIVVFTEDAVRPQPGWLASAISSLESRPDAVGVRGPVICPKSDLLYEYALEDRDGVDYLGCNVAYRRAALRQCGGFYPGFYFAHEGRDLGLRMERLGPVLFEPSMVVEYLSRPFTVRTWVHRGRFVRDDWVLFLRHPSSRPSRWPTRWAPLFMRSVRWMRLARNAEVVRGSARRASRLALIAFGELAVAGWVTLSAWHAVWAEEKSAADTGEGVHGERPSLRDDSLSPERTLRIAYLGPSPVAHLAGPPECAWLILEQLAHSGVRLDCYLTVTDNREQLDAVAQLPGARVISVGTVWRFDRWYSSRDLTKMVTELVFKALGRRRLVGLLAEQHQLDPYDALYQFSTIESFGRRADRRRLPPVVLHPSVHAAGELCWMYRERELSRRCEGWLRPRIIMSWYWVRSRRQRRDIRRASVVLALSEAFGRHLIEDYGVEPERVRVVPNPIDLAAFQPAPVSATPPPTPLRLVVIGRISVRKGVEQIVELSRRLGDLGGSVQLEVFGGNTQWSDYRALLKDLAPEVASYRGFISRADLQRELPTWDLLLHPAKYEPFGLTVGEALACGVPVVVTTEVGSGESVSIECCTKIAVGDIDDFEGAVREMVARMRSPEAAVVRLAARREAERLWSATRVAGLVKSALAEVAAPKPSSEPSLAERGSDEQS